MRFRMVVGLTLVLAAGLGGGVLLERHLMSMTKGAGAPSSDDRRILYWWDPMMPTYKSDKPGKSPMGMDMVPVYEGSQGTGEAGVVTVSPATAQNLGVRTVVVERARLAPVIETFGSVAFDESRISHVHVRAKGWIDRLQARVEGQTVARGDLLFEVFSPELISAAAEFTRELQRGGGDLAEVARRKLAALGLADRQVAEMRQTRQIPERIQVFAPRGGIVSGLAVAEGMFVQPEMTLMSITELDSVWIIAEVIESQAAIIKPGMASEVRLSSEPGRAWQATVDYVYPELRQETRTIRIRLRLPNTDRVLKPNMFVLVRFNVQPRESVLAIPSSALIRTGAGDRVVVALGDGRFKPVPVKAGISVGDKAEIVEGLNEGDRIVSSAQFLLDSESTLAGGLQRMSAAAAAETSEASHEPIWTEATVNAAPEDGMVNLSHPPIPAIGWPAMTMDFPIDPSVAVSSLIPGRRLKIALGRNADGTYRVLAVDGAAR